MRRLCAKSRARMTSIRPAWLRAKTFGTPASGSDVLPSLSTIRMRPGRSVTSMRPSGRKARDHGCSSRAVTVVTETGPAEDLTVCCAATGVTVAANARRPAARARIDMRNSDARDLRWISVPVPARFFARQAQDRQSAHADEQEAEDQRHGKQAAFV